MNIKTILFALGLFFGSFALAGAVSIFNVQQGGTGVGTFTSSRLLYGNGTNALSSVATTSATCTGSASCTAFTVIGSTPISISASGGSGGSGTVSTSTNETAGTLSYWTSNSATPALLGKVATTSLTATSPLSLSQAISVIGGSASVLTVATTTTSLFSGTAGQVLAFLNGGWTGAATTTFTAPLVYSGGAVSLTTSGAWTGNAGTATALAANGSNCAAGQFPLGVDTLGAVETCTDAWTEAENTSAAYAAQATTFTVAGTAQQVTSSAGAQSLAANRTWTLSLPSYVLFPSSYSAALGSTTNATSTNLTVTTLASTTNLIVSSAGGAGTRCAQFAADGTISPALGACGTAGGAAGTFSTTTSTVSGQLTNFPNNSTDIVTIGANSTTSAKFYFDPNTVTASFGTGGTGTSSASFGAGTNRYWNVGTFNSGQTGNGNFVIASSSNANGDMGTNAYFTVYQGGGFVSSASSTINGNLTILGNATTTNATTTALAVSNLTSGNCVQVSTGGNLINSPNGACGSASGISAYDAFPRQTTFNTAMSATSSPIWFKGALYASSTPTLPNQIDYINGSFATTTQATTTSLAISSLVSALHLGNATGGVIAYAGSSCSANNYATSISAIGALTCGQVSLTAGVSGDLPFSSLAQVSPNSVLGNISGATADAASVATSSLFTFSSGFSQATGILNLVEHHSFTYATSTAWAGTTTIPLEVGYGEVWNTAQCYTDIGTLNIQIGYYTASTTAFVASTTIGTVALTPNNTMTAGNKVRVDIGTPATAPTRITCTVKDTN